MIDSSRAVGGHREPHPAPPLRRSLGGMLVVAALAVAACTQVAPPPPSASPSASRLGTASASPSASTAAVSPSPVATVVASASPSATPVPTTCPIEEQQGNLPSDRLLDMKVATSDDRRHADVRLRHSVAARTRPASRSAT